MAKAGFWLRGAKGKLAGASIGKGSQGGTVIREIVSPKNPKTTAQMIQRIIWNTCIQAYVKFKELADHSFEGVTPGSACQQEFMRLNVRDLRNSVGVAIQNGVSTSAINDFIPVGSTELAHNTYVISKGSLPVITLADDEADAVSNVLAATANTYAGVAEALGLQRGDQITLVQIANINGAAQMKYARVILDPINADGTQAEMSVAFVTDGAINLPSPRNTGEFARIAYDAEAGGVSFALVSTNNSVLGAAAIASRLNSDKTWLRSNSEITFKLSAGYIYSLEEALAMTQAGVQTLSDLYLNNAGQGLVANFDEGGSSSVAGISGVFVNGIAVSNSGTTSVALRNANSIIINVRNADVTTQVAYRVNSGNWNAASASSGSHTFSNIQLNEGDQIQFSIGDSTTGSYIATRVYGAVVEIEATPVPRISAVSVGGTSIASTGTTNVNAGANVAVNVTTVNTSGEEYASYRIGSGSWATPVAVNSDAAQLTIPQLSINDRVSFAIGTGSASATFSPSNTWGGVAVVPQPSISSVRVGNTNIASSGSTDVAEGSNVSVAIATANGSGTYASYRIGSGSWANPVAVNNNAATLTIPTLSANDVVSFAISASSTDFAPVDTYGGTALAKAATIASVTANGQSVANTGTTQVAAGQVAIVVNTLAANGKYVSYKIGSGSWATPVAVNNDTATLNATLSADDVATIALGEGSTSAAFTASQTWGGTVSAVLNIIQSVTYKGVNIPSSGVTDVDVLAEGYASFVVDSSANGKYVSARVSGGTWANRVQISDGQATLNSVISGASTAGAVIEFAVGTSTSINNFTPEVIWGGKARTVNVDYFSNVQFGGSDWDEIVTMESGTQNVTGSLTFTPETGKRVGMFRTGSTTTTTAEIRNTRQNAWVVGGDGASTFDLTWEATAIAASARHWWLVYGPYEEPTSQGGLGNITAEKVYPLYAVMPQTT